MNASQLFAGLDTAAPVLAGGERRYAFLDHAASTPPLRAVLDAVNAFAPWYANVHRGQGFKSRLSSWALEEAREIVLEFVGADPAHDVVVFTRNATEALNHAAQQWPLQQDAVVITTEMEHHSNDLPWRRAAHVEHARVTADGAVDEQHLKDLIAAHQGRFALLAVTGASNVTGIVNPVHRWARWAHEAGARIVVDGAQLLPHRRIAMKAPGDPEHLDAVAFSGHKMYAPFGVGALVAPRAVLERTAPRLVGGGTVDIVSLERVVWTSLPERDEAGTPSVIGAVALGAAIRTLNELGWERIAEHEQRLAQRATAGLATVPGLTLYGRTWNSAPHGQLAVFAANVAGIPNALVGAILDHEWAIGTRCGCFCAHPYVRSLIHMDAAAAAEMERRIEAGDRSAMPGMVRMSMGLASTEGDVDRVVEALQAIVAGRHGKDYVLNRATGEWAPPQAKDRFASYFKF